MMNTNMLMNWILDLIIPRQNKIFSTIHGYLSLEEIQSLSKPNKSIAIPDRYIDFVDTVVVASDYKNNLISDLIQRAKFFGETAISEDLAKLVFTKLKHQEINISGVVCFVPPDPKRFNQRGFHLPKLIAHHLARMLEIQTKSLLVKQKSTVPQVELNKEERVENLRDVFAVDKNQLDKNINEIWLIDDVTTTFTTFGECARSLKRVFPKAKIHCLAVAG